uniref:IFM5 protein n=1 Tax=Aquila chrysaetos chrysaetos TaxID=223781 RepID=A0A663EQX1_AQUCH
MENFPQSVSINMQPYGRNRAGSPATAFGPTITSFVQPEPVPNPQDFVLWSFFNTLFGNFFCLGFVALIFSIKVSQKSPPVPPLLCLARGSRLSFPTLLLGNVMLLGLGRRYSPQTSPTVGGRGCPETQKSGEAGLREEEQQERGLARGCHVCAVS